MNYFKDVTNQKELKEQYRKLALKYHPDQGGDQEMFKAMQNELEEILKNPAFFIKSENKEDASFYNFQTREQVWQEFEEFNSILSQIIYTIHEGAEIEIVGTWIWITGNTYPHKDLFKSLGFKFSGKKIAWYFHHGQFKKYNRKNYSLNQIREKYGTVKITETDKLNK